MNVESGSLRTLAPDCCHRLQDAKDEVFNSGLKFAMFWLRLPLSLCAYCPLVQASSPPVLWQAWSDETITQARREHKFVLLNLENAWCHWCRVMDQQTYNDSDVGRLMGESYIAVKVDQSLRPDISNRYYGYDPPVTIIYNADGSEIVSYKNLKYLARISVMDSLNDIGDGNCSAAPGIGYSWYAGI